MLFEESYKITSLSSYNLWGCLVAVVITNKGFYWKSVYQREDYSSLDSFKIAPSKTQKKLPQNCSLKKFIFDIASLKILF